jgi:expansin (peptidoglycan-binding protein)
VTLSTAISHNLYDDPTGSASCGKCVELNGQTLLVVDQCPDCAMSHLDLGSQATYESVTGNAGGGSVPDSPGVPVKFVPCPVTGSIEYSVSSASSAYYLAMVILNAKYGIASVSCRATGTSTFTPMNAPTDADPRWNVSGFQIPNPIDFQVTDEWGQVVEDDAVAWSPGETITGRDQFPTCP